MKEDPTTGRQIQTTTAYLTFVHLDKDGAPQKVNALAPGTEDERRRFENAKIRVQARRELRKKLKKN